MNQEVCISSPLGTLKVEGNSKGITGINFVDEEPIQKEPIPETLRGAVTQLQEYFNGTRTSFDLVLNPNGTPFQKKVWNKLLDIPYGKTCSYLDMAKALGDPKVIRAAASANGKNPISIVIPCHRVIGSDGSLTGYASGLHRKKWLLDLESPVMQTVLF